MSLTAGFCEEFLYRGYFIWALAPWLGWWGAAALSDSTFRLFEHEFDLRLCIGITKEELQFKMKHDGEKLLELFKRHGVYPFTDLERDSVPLDRQ